MKETEEVFLRLEELSHESNLLKHELLTTLDEKEKLILITEQLLKEKEEIQRRYENLRNSKLGKLTIWIWKKRRKLKNNGTKKY